ncbi:hypothetical protein [Bradyrhizobium sp. Gha]|uniref:hypothetical protein n=1 Tax=Bradyrhizobium sp. Gha TaxID=1855318 RepID=UPI0008EBA4D0|nr:hypothetical protein [Bradyrhizobium sp. Gha]SFK11057.1 hypothetical protein SAMN05216525_15335 [Bradyrhizobium sp. Gha]
MDDPHQPNTIITAAICQFFKDHAAGPISIEEAKMLGKEIIGALDSAGPQVTSASQRDDI